ncbi:MAG TPA: hypothetical protein VFG59_17010 [Anaeromyxobacter sp.]|nr:hypothetical protein [Anaeromyxobacter sp.]
MRDGSPDEVGRVSGEIDLLRREVGSLVTELDRRRHEMLDLRLQARRHPLVVLFAGTAAALVLAGLLSSTLRGRSRRKRPGARARETRRALGRLLEHPQRVAEEPRVATRIATAAGVAAGSAVARHLARRVMARMAPVNR